MKVLLEYKEFIVMVAVVIALFININAFRLQRRSLRANLFCIISSRINDLVDDWQNCGTIDKQLFWYERIFDAFEYFAFFANQKELSKEMKIYYKSGIETYVERLKWKQYSELYEMYKKRPKQQLSELKKYYKREIKKKFPF